MKIKGNFVPKGAKQFSHSSQDLDLEYNTYSVLLFQEQPVLVGPIEKKKGEWQGKIREEPNISL